MIRTFHHSSFEATELAATKARDGHTISVCLPARDEAATIGSIVECLRRDLVDDVGLIDEILVLDDHSVDHTAAVAAAAGATVVSAGSVMAELGLGPGKGQALWKSLVAAQGDLIVWCDADVSNFTAAYVTGLVGPLLHHPDLVFVKGYYDRPVTTAGEGGGRVTELVARPVISLLFPALAALVQPLAGEYAGRRRALEQVPFAHGYGVDIGLLIDLADRFGAEAIAQTDLGVRIHRNRSLAQLGPQAMAVLHTALSRAAPELIGSSPVLARPGHEPYELSVAECPPLADLPHDRRHSA